MRCCSLNLDLIGFLPSCLPPQLKELRVNERFGLICMPCQPHISISFLSCLLGSFVDCEGAGPLLSLLCRERIALSLGNEECYHEMKLATFRRGIQLNFWEGKRVEGVRYSYSMPSPPPLMGEQEEETEEVERKTTWQRNLYLKEISWNISLFNEESQVSLS